MKWFEFVPKSQYFGTYTQSVWDALDISKKKPSSLRVRVENLKAGDSVNVYVQEALINESTAYVNSSNMTQPVVSFYHESIDISQVTKVATLSLDGQWFRVMLVLDLALPEVAPSIQAEISYD